MRFAICLFVLSLLLACERSSEQPSMPDEEIAKLMVDLCIADAATTGLAGFPKDSLSKAYFDQVFELHRISLEQHNKNIQIICQDPERMRLLLEKAWAMMEEQQKAHQNK